jgi:hypothetical protein
MHLDGIESGKSHSIYEKGLLAETTVFCTTETLQTRSRNKPQSKPACEENSDRQGPRRVNPAARAIIRMKIDRVFKILP